MARRIAIVLGLAVALGGGCKSGDQGGTKQLQDQAPPKQVEVPAGVSIPVEVDGTAQPAITSDALKATKPDFVDDEHKVWLIQNLVHMSPGTVIEATAPSGMSVKFTHPTPEGFEPGLFLTRRGELLIYAVDPKDPFPKWHGQGGRLHRAGDPLPHVPVARIAITSPKP